jgi:Predicted DNA-binding proteins
MSKITEDFMARPKQNRQVSTAPKITYFKPRGIPLVGLEEVRLSVEELEALRLADLEALPCCEACRLMGVSRHTFGRVLNSARRAVAEALVVGKALRIEGGNWVFADDIQTTCRNLEQNRRGCSDSGLEEKE